MQKASFSAYEGRQVVLVDENDKEIGVEDILEAHRGVGKKHRALSVILYRRVDGKTEILLQKRSGDKPVFKHLWSNTCCTNLRPGDAYIERAVSRLKEEMGIEVKQEDLRIIYRFSYEALDTTNNGWCENEVDTVIVGAWNGEVELNPAEAEDAKWMELGDMRADMERNPYIYSPWHKLIINDPRFVESL